MARISSTLFLLAHFIVWVSGAPSEPELFLSKYIKAGELDKARELSADHMKQFHLKSSTREDLVSYSGYLTVDEKANSNIFFWFFPAIESPETAPVIVWFSEMAGFSCLVGALVENGPFYLDENLELKDRNDSWVKTHSMLYIDAPVGVGFSFSDNQELYKKAKEGERLELHEALIQFFTLFSDYQKRDLYFAGEFTASIHATAITDLIHSENEKSPKLMLNLKGLILGSPVVNMQHQVNVANHFYNMGILDEKQRDEMVAEEAVTFGHVQNRRFEEAYQSLKKLVMYPGNMYYTYTGLGSSTNLMKSKPPPENARFLNFVRTNEVHNYLHVGLHKFSFVNWNIHDQFTADIMSVNGSKLERVLSEGYKVLIHAGQFDPVVVQPGVTKAIDGLKWEGAEGFKQAPRKIWRVKDDVAGYVRSSGPLTYAIVRNTGRNIMNDNPQWGYDLVQRFTSGKGFD